MSVLKLNKEQKIEWLRNASNDELLKQLISFEGGNHFGKYDEDIELTKAEILHRMEGGA